MSEPDLEALDRRLRTVERRLDGDVDPSAGEDAPAGSSQQTERLDALEETVTDLEAAVQAIRGYVGTVRANDRTPPQGSGRKRANHAADEVDAAADSGWNSSEGADAHGPTRPNRRRRAAERASDGGRRASGGGVAKPGTDSPDRTVARPDRTPPEHSAPSERTDEWGLEDRPDPESEPSAGLLARIRDVL